MSEQTFAALTLLCVTCCREGCGITFGVADTWVRCRKRDHEWWYCPNGHRQHWPQESDLEAAERRARESRDALARERARHDQTKAARDAAQRSASAARGIATRIKNRVSAGVCPCCNRTFQNLAQHMAGAHPKWDPKS